MVKENNKLFKSNKVKIELYKIAEENHRFYVDKRFTIISLYFPLVTIILTGFYTTHLDSNLFLFICGLGFFLTLFLYFIENRNWILSNICLEMSNKICSEINSHNLHERLLDSDKHVFPEKPMLMDKLARKIGRSQHKSVRLLTYFLLLYWIALLVSPFLFSLTEN